MGAKLLPLTKRPGGKVGKIWGGATILGEPVIWMQRSEITTGFIDAALPFMDKAQADGKPFYINLWPDDVHSPFWPPLDKWGNDKRELYLGVLEAMDEQFGKLFNYVRDNDKLRNNTLILVCSDNGCEKGAGQAGPLKGYKTHLYEGGIRSSLVAWGPGLMPKNARGTRNKGSLFSAIDIAPSLLKLTGARAPTNTDYDGEDVLDTILGKSQASRKAPIFYGRPPDRKNFYGFNNLPDLAMRSGKWKLLCDFDGGRPELFDIPADPGESKNLAAQHPELVDGMKKKVLAWYARMSK